MSGTVTAKEVAKLLEGRKSAKMLKIFFRSAGEDKVFEALNAYAGDFPETIKIRRLMEAFNVPESDLRRMAESENTAKRRIGRLILLGLLAGSTEDSLLQKGLTDPNAQIRTDTARFTGAGVDRTRLYNQLIKIIREDPDSRVRAAAGKRLATSFADLYTVDFQGLPPISRMLILDALEGITRSDEERAEVLLQSEDAEASFRAARALQRWGTLARLFESGSSEMHPILEASATKGVVGFLENTPIKASHTKLAVKLAGLAGRDDIVRNILGSQAPEKPTEDLSLRDIENLEQKLFSLSETGNEDLDAKLRLLPLDETNFHRSVTLAFPPPEKDRITGVVFRMAALGGWNDWVPRIIDALNNEDPDIRSSAASSLTILNPKKASEELPALLTDPVDRVRESAAKGLASLASEGGGGHLAEYLSCSPPEEEKESVLAGIREAGGAALARCIIDNTEYLDDNAKGDLLAHGMDSVAVELLIDGFTTTASLKKAAAAAGPDAGESFLAAWNVINSSARGRLLSWIVASGWSTSLPLRLKKGGRNEKKRIRDLLAPLSTEEKHVLFDTVDKRRLKGLI